METTLISKKKIQPLVKYLYSNDLKEDEVYECILSVCDKIALDHIDKGCVIQRNNSKRIKNAKQKQNDKNFNIILEGIEDEIYNRANPQKTK
jgi:hypothetical protein